MPASRLKILQGIHCSALVEGNAAHFSKTPGKQMLVARSRSGSNHEILRVFALRHGEMETIGLYGMDSATKKPSFVLLKLKQTRI